MSNFVNCIGSGRSQRTYQRHVHSTNAMLVENQFFWCGSSWKRQVLVVAIEMWKNKLFHNFTRFFWILQFKFLKTTGLIFSIETTIHCSILWVGNSTGKNQILSMGTVLGWTSQKGPKILTFSFFKFASKNNQKPNYFYPGLGCKFLKLSRRSGEHSP